MSQIQKIGLFDSGLGGLTVFRTLQESLPDRSYVYLGDTARTPYGSKGAATIQRYSEECAQFLASQKIDLLIVACNTASCAALPRLRERCSFPVIGTIEPAVRAALRHSSGGPVGVIGTEATIGSGAYQSTLRASQGDIQIFAKPCPLFVPLVEQGMCEGEIVEKVVELYLSELRGKISSLILGCTHYPLLRDVISRYLGPAVHIVECSHAIADEVRELVEGEATASSSPCSMELGVERFFVTDDAARFNKLADIFLGRSDTSATVVEELLGGIVVPEQR